VAIKFYIDGNAFLCEKAAFLHPDLRRSMHALVMMEPSQKVRRGSRLPPSPE
jgi:hypothetical protein